MITFDSKITNIAVTPEIRYKLSLIIEKEIADQLKYDDITDIFVDLKSS